MVRRCCRDSVIDGRALEERALAGGRVRETCAARVIRAHVAAGLPRRYAVPIIAADRRVGQPHALLGDAGRVHTASTETLARVLRAKEAMEHVLLPLQMRVFAVMRHYQRVVRPRHFALCLAVAVMAVSLHRIFCDGLVVINPPSVALIVDLTQLVRPLVHFLRLHLAMDMLAVAMRQVARIAAVVVAECTLGE